LNLFPKLTADEKPAKDEEEIDSDPTVGDEGKPGK
jgi:hypothetical protein